MAVLHQATLVPSKLEMLESWLPSQPWFDSGDSTSVDAVGAYRFDDADGEVGIETHLLRSANGRTFQVPVTYRGSPKNNSESFLIGTSHHSVLGERWVYDASGDVTYLTALAAIILCGGHEAELVVMTKNGPVRRESSAKVLGSGSKLGDIRVLEPLYLENHDEETCINTSDFKFVLSRVIKDKLGHGAENTLSGTWPGQNEPALLAFVHKT